VVAGVGAWTYVDAMEQPPFPVALVVLVAFFGFLAVVSESLWIKIIAAIGAFFVAAAAVYQSLPKRVEGAEMDDPVDGPVDDGGSPS
jgi:hypothetical protein